MSCFLTALLIGFIVVTESRDCGDDYSCPDSATCCRLPDGKWGCCPMEDAVCCEDHIHCCPSGSRCMETSCVRGSGEFTTTRKKSKAQKRNFEGEIICPDRRSKCPTGATCCLLSEGSYGCCPVEHANCCLDHLHCCPSGYTCDASGQRCIQAENFHIIGSYRKFHSTPIRTKPGVYLGDVDEEEIDELIQMKNCGHGKMCPARSTCCVVSEGSRFKHMCCPLQNGVCCEHSCCPSGYHCRPNGKCEKRASFDGNIDFKF